jgi:putative membrane protein insertion efficiency factor
VAELFDYRVPRFGTAQNNGQDRGKLPMKHSSSCTHGSTWARDAQRLPRNAGRALIWIYRHTLSPLVGYNCRHLPTCSVYGDEAIERFGLWAGGWMTLARLLRCQPFGTSGIDNVPGFAPPGARWFLPWRYARWRGVNGP